MSNDLENLQTRLDELHDRLTSADSVSPEVRDRLVQLMADIHRLLGPGGSPGPANKSAEARALVDQISEAGQRFQATHPVIAGTLGKLADALGQLGI